MIASRYFQNTTNTVRNASGQKMGVDYRIPKAYICKNKVCMPETFVLVKDVTDELILAKPWFLHLYPLVCWDEKEQERGVPRLLANPDIDEYKIAFNVPMGQFEWNVMPFGLKNAPLEFQNIMNDIFMPHNKSQLQRFLESLNYISPFVKDLKKDTAILYDRLKKNPKAWSARHTIMMASRGSSSSFRGRGGRNSPKGRSNVLAQIRNQSLISLSIASSSFSGMNTDEQTYQEFLEFMKFKSKKQGDNEVPSYSSIIKDDNGNTELYECNKTEKVIIFLENHDLRWKDNPWQLMQSKLNQQTGDDNVHGHQLIESIKMTVAKYRQQNEMESPHEQEDLSPFKNITRKIQMKKGTMTKTKILASYMEEVEKDLFKNLDQVYTSDMSISSAGEFLVGESQDIQSDKEIDLDDYLQKFLTTMEESSSIAKNKGEK
ncbi:hypothetical protein FXO37_20308 [Capsicum annuum]|nr:hypothetical protein FXO37_20308 [Capsicum annuum]